MPKLFQINVYANSGSHGKIAEDIGIVARRKGWQSYIAYGRIANPSKSVLFKIGGWLDVILHALYTRLTDRHGLASTRPTQNLIQKIKEIKPDIIHLHNIHGYYINYKLLFEYLNSTDIPIVWTLHDCWPFTGHCAFFESINCYKWKNSCYHCKVDNYYPKAFADNSLENFKLKKLYFTSNNNLCLVPVSNWLAGYVGESFLKNKKIKVIHNGINISSFAPCTDGNDENIILGVANVWDYRKGLHDFIKLAEILGNRYKIVLVGLSKPQIKDLPAGIAGIEHTESVHELASLYSSAKAYINFTYEDNFPSTNIEALACGTPVITYRTGGCPEAITPSTGFIIRQGDIQGAVDAINEIERVGKSHYSKVCRKYAETHYNKDNQFEKYIELYNELLSNR
ncbi:MAG: glycosyltransferase [Muribaculaceae bacterium]|nr:glycosyltransferase [Muribaculaceae bacterium]